MNGNDAKLTRLYVAQVGSPVQDDCPNGPAPGRPPARQFDLVLEAMAGGNVGSSGAPYVLRITATDETTVQPVAAMSLTLPPQAFDAAHGWDLSANQAGFVNIRRFTVDVPPYSSGHLFHFTATLMSANCQLASFINSDQFLLL